MPMDETLTGLSKKHPNRTPPLISVMWKKQSSPRMRYVFSYKAKKTGPEKRVSRPYAEVWLDVQGRKLSFDFLVDSGADRTVINQPLGLALGFEVLSGETPVSLGGVGGVASGYLRDLSLWIGEVQITTEIIWVQSDRVPLLLGQRDVFDRFDITFSKSEEKIVFDLKKWVFAFPSG